jgi:hypothetical protein
MDGNLLSKKNTTTNVKGYFDNLIGIIYYRSNVEY